MNFPQQYFVCVSGATCLLVCLRLSSFIPDLRHASLTSINFSLPPLSSILYLISSSPLTVWWYDLQASFQVICPKWNMYNVGQILPNIQVTKEEVMLLSDPYPRQDSIFILFNWGLSALWYQAPSNSSLVDLEFEHTTFQAVDKQLDH